MSREAASSRWDHTAAMLCTLRNIHRSKKDRAVTYHQCHPFLRDSAPRRQPTTPAMLREMKGMFDRVVVEYVPANGPPTEATTSNGN